MRVFGWSLLAAVGGAALYGVFGALTGLSVSLFGIPAGLAIGLAARQASGRQGTPGFQALAVFLAYLAFTLTYAPGMFAIVFKDGMSAAAAMGFLMLTAISPVADAENRSIGGLMLLMGMYVAWLTAGLRAPRTAP